MANNNHHLLLIDSDQVMLDSLGQFLTEEGFNLSLASSYREAISKLRENSYSLVIMDFNLPDGDGFELLETITTDYPQTVVIVITGYGTIENAVSAIKRGAYDYLTKPIADDDLRVAIERAIRQQTLISENEDLRSRLEGQYSLESIISQNYKMAKIFDLVQAVADSKTTVLMTGDSGTGKTMLARAIHQLSSRRDKPFVEVSCGALPDSLLESELFGYVKGAFTGAERDKPGKFITADGGTIFLDEIANSSPSLQVKLLRVIQDKTFEPVGSNKAITVDTRVILATNEDLAEKVKQGQFREDLYYRVNVVNINLPPLHERVGDIELLANHFLRDCCSRHNRHKLGISDDTMQQLERYHWPGNVRELENVIERAVLLGQQRYIDLDDLPDEIKEHHTEDQSQYKQMTLKEALAESEKQIIKQALEAYQWKRQATADALDINRTTLFNKMKTHGLYEEAEQIGLT